MKCSCLIEGRLGVLFRDSLLAEYSENNLDRLYAVGNGVDEVLGIYDESGTQYLHSNHVGSITGVTDERGNIKGFC